MPNTRLSYRFPLLMATALAHICQAETLTSWRRGEEPRRRPIRSNLWIANPPTTEAKMITPWLFDIFNYPWSPDAAKFDIEGCQDFFDWHLESWELAERAGFEGVFFSEHHYTPYALSPSPNLLIAAIAQRTRRLKLGVMANIVPMHNPRRLAEEFAMLDYLTHGRLEIGLGRGVDEHEFAREGIPLEETRPRFQEGLRLIEEMLSKPVFTHTGKYSNFEEETSVWPQPKQPMSDRPPVWITAL